MGLEIQAIGHTLVVTVERGEKNLFSIDMMDRLSDAILTATGDGLRFVRVRARGPVFCVGRERKASAPLELREEAARIVRVNETIRTTPLTVIAEVNGDAAGFGAGLVAACDICVSAEDAHFWFPEILAGLAPSIVISWLSKMVPHKIAFDLVTSSEPLDANEAKELGLVNEVVPADRLEQAVDDRIERLASMDAAAIREIKEFFVRTRSLGPTDAAASSIEALALSASRIRSREGPAPIDDRLLQDERGTYDTAEYAEELAAAKTNHEIGTRLLFENDHIRVFESKLEPGERADFHIHDKPYFWTVVDAGRGLQRLPDGTWMIHDFTLGETVYRALAADDPLIHDLENVGGATLRFVTVELSR